MFIMTACFLNQAILDKLTQMGHPHEHYFIKEFQEHLGQQISWSMVHWFYLGARAAHYRTIGDPSVQEILWVSDVLYGHQHLLWFGLLCSDRATLDHVILCYENAQSQGAAYLHRLWEHFKNPAAAETPTPQLRAEFHPQLRGTAGPVQTAAEYARCVRQIKPQAEDSRVGLQTAFANVSSAPTIVYSWDSGAFAASE